MKRFHIGQKAEIVYIKRFWCRMFKIGIRQPDWDSGRAHEYLIRYVGHNKGVYKSSWYCEDKWACFVIKTAVKNLNISKKAWGKICAIV